MDKNEKIIAGLDLSLTHTGFVVLKSNGEVLSRGVIKSKPTGPLPVNEIKRIVDIVKTIADNFIQVGDIDLVLIEGLSFMSKGTSLVQLSGLNYLIRKELFTAGIPFVIVAPTTLKKFITGSGKGEKDQMMMKVYRDYRFEASDNNENDAFCLAAVGSALLGVPLSKMLKSQEETLKLLKKQL